MTEIVEVSDYESEKYKQISPNLYLPQLNDLESDGVSIQCVNSSEFVVGKQTNFNGPVTIINCANGEGNPKDPEKEKIVIRDKVLSKSAEKMMLEVAGKNEKREEPNQKKQNKEWKKEVAAWMSKNSLRVPLIIFVGLLFGLAVILMVLYIKPNTPQDEEKCVPFEESKFNSCIYSDYAWGKCWTSNEPPIQLPVPYVVVAQTHGSYCYVTDICLQVMREHQCYPNNTSENKITCSFMIGGDGNVYEDRGWTSPHSLCGPASGKSVLICLMGDFTDWDYPTYPQLESAKSLIKMGVKADQQHQQQLLFSPPTRRHFIYSKEEWGGRPPTSAVLMKLPVPYVIVSHSVTSECDSLETCSSLLQNMQEYHFSKEYADIAYNFLVDSAGNVYEGRGWNHRNVHGGFENGRNLDICFIGDFSKNTKPTPRQFKGVELLIQMGVKNRRVSKSYSLISANSTYETLSPGQNVYQVIKHWPHFDPDPASHVKEYDE